MHTGNIYTTYDCAILDILLPGYPNLEGYHNNKYCRIESITFKKQH